MFRLWITGRKNVDNLVEMRKKVCTYAPSDLDNPTLVIPPNVDGIRIIRL
jgi:hypothetical protein